MKNKQKAWRESSRSNTIKGELTHRQWLAASRHNSIPSKLIRALKQRFFEQLFNVVPA